MRTRERERRRDKESESEQASEGGERASEREVRDWRRAR